MYTSCIQPPQIRSSSTHMTLTPSNAHNLHSIQLQIKSSSTQMTIVHSNVHNLYSTPSNHSNHVLFNSKNLHYPQRCTNALNQFNHHSNASNMHSSITSIQTPSNQVFFNSSDLNTLKCAQLALNTLKSLKSCPFLFKEPSSPSKMHKCNQSIQITIQMHQTCIQVSQAYRPPSVHLNISNVPISKLPSTYRCPKCATMYLQRKAPKRLMRTLKSLKIHSLTN